MTGEISAITDNSVLVSDNAVERNILSDNRVLHNDGILDNCTFCNGNSTEDD